MFEICALAADAPALAGPESASNMETRIREDFRSYELPREPSNKYKKGVIMLPILKGKNVTENSLAVHVP